jgi:branched-chain amino acid transport system ATP-binding protein
MLRILNLEAGYGPLRVLKGISLHVSPGEIVALIGANGAEKIVELGCSLVPEGRHVFSTLTVRENLLLGAFARRRRDNGSTVAAGLEEVYELFGILKERQQQLAGTLSGGQQQMLAIGRALMSSPKLLMMDEPSLGVAPLIARDIFQTVTRLKQTGLTVLLVEQNARAALAVADRGYVIETGQIVLEGTARELCNNPEVQRAYLGKEYKTIDEDV